MLRSYRHILLAIVGLIAAAIVGFQLNQFYEAAEQQHPNYNYQPAGKPGYRIDARSQTPTEHYKPSCNNPNNREDADLCAQWAAVDQVAEANRLASLNSRIVVLTLVATIIGTIALIWTLMETRMVARRELRAYVSTKPTKTEFSRANGRIRSQITSVNDGNTPAYNVGSGGNILICEPEHAARELARPERPSEGIRCDVVLHKAENSPAYVVSEPIFTPENEAALAKREKFVFVFGSTFYTDVFGAEHASHFCYCLENFGEGPPAWVVTPFHNSAT